MTFLDIYQDVAHRCDKNPTSPDVETRTRINTFINDRYRQLLRMPGVLDLRDDVFTAVTSGFSIVSTANENRLVLPTAISAVTNLFDSTNRIKLQQRTLTWIRERDPSQPGTASGTPLYYAILNMSGVVDLPSSAASSQLEIRSTSAADVGSPVTIEYVDPAGGLRVIQVAVNGTNQVLIPASIASVLKVAVESPQAGQINLNDFTAAKTLAFIPANSLVMQTSNLETSRGWVLWLWPTPAGAYAYTVDGSRPRTTLVEDLDEPMIPEDFHTLLVWGACEDEMLKMDDDRAGSYADRWRADVAALRGFLHQARGERLVPYAYGRRVGWTPLGSNFPPWQ